MHTRLQSPAVPVLYGIRATGTFVTVKTRRTGGVVVAQANRPSFKSLKQPLYYVWSPRPQIFGSFVNYYCVGLGVKLFPNKEHRFEYWMPGCTRTRYSNFQVLWHDLDWRMCTRDRPARPAHGDKTLPALLSRPRQTRLDLLCGPQPSVHWMGITMWSSRREKLSSVVRVTARFVCLFCYIVKRVTGRLLSQNARRNVKEKGKC